MKINQIKELIASIDPKDKLTPLEQLLIYAVDSLLNDREMLLNTVQELKDEIRYLKNEKGKPKIKANKKDSDDKKYSSEKERRVSKKHKKSSKKNKINTHRTETRYVDKSQLPDDAKFKGYDEVIIQNLKIVPDNILFRLERYYSKSQRKTYRAQIDPEFSNSDFSPELKAFIIDLNIRCRMSEYQIFCFLNDKEVSISEGTISNMLTQKLEPFHQEADNIYQKGLKSKPYHQLDETGARHKGKNGSTMVICGEDYTRFLTSNSKNRFHILYNRFLENRY